MSGVIIGMAPAAALRASTPAHPASIAIVKSSSDLIIAGYASVEMVDKQGDLITRGALKDAFGNFMKADGFRNVQLAHSNIQVGEVIKAYTDSEGRLWKSGVDDAGMFVVIILYNIYDIVFFICKYHIYNKVLLRYLLKVFLCFFI